MEFKIRHADPNDVQAILDIINYEINFTTNLYDYHERTIKDLTDWFNKKQIDGHPVIVAEEKNEILGYGSYGEFRQRAAYQYTVEHSIYVSKNARGKGVGRQLMKELIHLATEQGFHTMIAGIDGANQFSQEFHRKFGFVEVGRLKEVGYKFDKWLDLVFMQLILKKP